MAASKARHAAPMTPVAVSAHKTGREMCKSSKKPYNTGAMAVDTTIVGLGDFCILGRGRRLSGQESQKRPDVLEQHS